MAKKSSKTSLGMDENIEALLAYVLGWLTGIVFLVVEKKSKFVKFHAAQSLVVFLTLSVLAFIFGLIPILGWVLAVLIDLLAFILWIILMLKAYQGEEWEVPILGEYARKLVK